MRWNWKPDIGNDLSNDYLREIARIRLDDESERWTVRQDLVRKYAWAIPTREALFAIVETCSHFRVSDIVSVGAGTGFWEQLISQMWRGSVFAYDIAPPSSTADENDYKHTTQYYPVGKGGSEVAGWHGGGSALFLSWPPYDTEMAETALACFPGSVVIYIGEGWGGCTGNNAFHDALEKDWKCVSRVQIPRWEGINDSLSIWVRVPSQA